LQLAAGAITHIAVFMYTLVLLHYYSNTHQYIHNHRKYLLNTKNTQILHNYFTLLPQISLISPQILHPIFRVAARRRRYNTSCYIYVYFGQKHVPIYT
jgi:glutamate synthase domain-containing protein 3